MCRRVLCYGDSNTYGYDPRSYLGGRYPEAVRWTALLNAEGWQIINRGENGRSIPRQGWEIETAIQAIRCAEAEILIIMLGSNDLLQNSSVTAEICGKRMEQFLTAILADTQESKMLLISPPPMEPGAWVSDPGTLEESHRLAGCYKTVARRLGIAYADAGAWGIGLAYDGVHFSEEGHQAFAKGIQAVLKNLIEQDDHILSSE